MHNKVVYLTGFMGSGKSTIAPILANTLGWEFYDLDKIIESQAGMKITDIFKLYGEEHFRKLERDSLLEVSKNNKAVVSLGGGTIANDINLGILKKTGILFYLNLSPESVYKRMKYKRDRPVLFADLAQGFSKEDLLNKIKELYDKRKNYYEQSDFIISTDNMPVGKTVDQIVKIIQKELE